MKVKLLQDELRVLKLKVVEVTEENRLLHEEIKRSTVQEIINEGIEVSGVGAAIYIFKKSNLVLLILK